MSLINHFKDFWPHVDELRRRIIIILVAFIVCSLCSYQFVGIILPWVVKPAGHLIFTAPLEAFSAYMTLSLVMGFLISLPLTIYQVWAFVGCALRPQEKKLIAIFAPLSFLLFLVGVSFAYFVAVPLTFRFLLSFSSDYLQPMITVSSYMGFFAQMLIAFGLAFEMPLALAFLAAIGIATPQFLSKKRRHAIMIILIFATIIAPPDVVSQVLLTLPLIVLYEVGIIFSRFSFRGNPSQVRD